MGTVYWGIGRTKKQKNVIRQVRVGLDYQQRIKSSRLRHLLKRLLLHLQQPRRIAQLPTRRGNRPSRDHRLHDLRIVMIDHLIRSHRAVHHSRTAQRTGNRQRAPSRPLRIINVLPSYNSQHDIPFNAGSIGQMRDI